MSSICYRYSLEVKGQRELCFFPDIAEGPVLAPYDYESNSEQKAAIIYPKYGGGRVVLSGVHIEYDPALMDNNDKYLKNIIHVLK